MVFKLATTPLLSRNINVLLSTAVAAKVPTAFTSLPLNTAASIILKNGFNNFAAPKRLYVTSNKTYYDKDVIETDINIVASIETNDSSNVVSLNTKSTVTTTVNPGTLKAFYLLSFPAKLMNFGRWNDQERSSIIDKFLSLNKEFNKLDMFDYDTLSNHVSTRSPLQCHS